jgi:hypothetical protein
MSGPFIWILTLVAPVDRVGPRLHPRVQALQVARLRGKVAASNHSRVQAYTHHPVRTTVMIATGQSAQNV